MIKLSGRQYIFSGPKFLMRSRQRKKGAGRYCRWREDLPVLYQHLLPDDLAHDLSADAEQLGEWGVRVVEAVQQNL